ncbi:hypothetical protein CAS74_003756 [Pichia kudriavzevii]|uniref:DNA-directed RNA polymerase III subunit RPC4 n=1 Tax=Pichia kudriavzevii TaxID=4909 RepID=A0A099P2S4_PICKU|nr:uncharacterized protein C5L36_0B06590 [Pichia kudriavzevii]AWU75414.1 hypothetical protein C5L36_0B06590 [Pichia kudriavzevii]KGK38492.1 hypothetical protein JL09_g2375 [Pichia kudriavzevii]ONH74095.1 DNA-directed RNA polymerase III subunit RPC4 [Pichia kudriavzevii]OUT21635.1 hypothetical protein CAS74_003756 [Pichia kudriavzevii]
MSKRLDSINPAATSRAAPSGVKPSLKFKPKIVSRKSKEERENAGKINTPGVNRIAEKKNRMLANKKPGAGPKSRKVNGQLVMSGPLSEGTISLGGVSGGVSSTRTSGASNPLLERLKAKANKKFKVKKEDEDDEKKLSMHYDDEDEDSDIDDNAIDMSKKSILDSRDGDGDIDLDQLDTDLFPIRAERNEHREYGEEAKTDKTIKTEFHNAASVIPSEPGTRETTALSGGDVRSRSATPGANTLSTLDNADDGLHMNDFQEKQEIKGMNEDYSALAKSLKTLNIKEGGLKNMFFLQLPCSLPVLENGTDGMVGKIRIHKSGKMTMKIGKVKFEISRGGSSDFVQEVVMVDPENGNCYHVGSIKEKITAIPKIM